jgi:PhnB protein
MRITAVWNAAPPLLNVHAPRSRTYSPEKSGFIAAYEHVRIAIGCSRRNGENTFMQLNTYLNYGGNCEQAFRFYEQHLGGKITMMMRHGEQPDASQVPPEWKNAVLHARISVGGTELLGADIPPDRFQPMRSAYLSLTVTSVEEAERLYALLSDGGQIFMPMEETFFAVRFAMLRDRFGTSWMLLHPRPRQ